MCLAPLRVTHPRIRSEERNVYHGRSLPSGTLESEYQRELLRYTPQYIYVPCGSCIDCRKARASQWRVRMLHECQFGGHKNAIFVTLTISNSYYKRFRNEPQKAIRLFMDRWRKIYGTCPVRWFTTELGEKSGRLHFHGIIWDVPFYRGSDVKSLKICNRTLAKIWRYGFTWTGYVSDATVNYIVKYITKPCPFNPDYRPIVLASPGIGACYLDESSLAHIRRHPLDVCKVHAGNRQWLCPRYYKLKAFTKRELQVQSFCRYDDPPDIIRYKDHTFVDSDSRERYCRRLYEESLNRNTSFRPQISPTRVSIDDYYSIVSNFEKLKKRRYGTTSRCVASYSQIFQF